MGELETWTLECIKKFSKMDVDYLLGLFDDDATIYEPFSSTGMVSGLAEIESFLKVFCKYSSFVTDMRTVKISIMQNTPNSTTAIVNLRKGMDAKFALDFDFIELSEPKGKKKRKIKKLRVRPHPSPDT